MVYRETVGDLEERVLVLRDQLGPEELAPLFQD
jgi:hypothetical protein